MVMKSVSWNCACKRPLLANLVTYVCMSNFYRVTIKYESLKGFLTKHTCIQMQSFSQVSLFTYQKPNVPIPSNNAVWQCYRHNNSIENTCILHYHDQENPYLRIYTHFHFCLSITGNRVFIYTHYKCQKICTCVQMVWMLPMYILLYICLPNVKSLVLQRVYCTCAIITGTLAVPYSKS